MVVTLAGGCRVSHMHDGEPFVERTLRVWPQIGRATGAQAISLRIMEFGAGMSPTIQNDECDQILYVLNRSQPAELSGRSEASPSAIFINDAPGEIGSDTGIYIRANQQFAIDNSGSDAITIVSSECPDPDRELRFAVPSVIDAKPISTNPPPIVRLADQKAQPTADRWYRVLIDERVGSTQVTQFVGSIPPGRAPDHFHNYEEVLFILKGQGRMWAGETNTPIEVGSCIYLPKGQVHCVENTGDSELRLLGVFYPAGSPSVRYEL